jgi:hypothetical protein
LKQRKELWVKHSDDWYDSIFEWPLCRRIEPVRKLSEYARQFVDQ